MIEKKLEDIIKSCGALKIQDTRGFGDMHGGYMFSEESLILFYEKIVQQCADNIRESFDSELAEPLAHNMEVDMGIKQDYA